MLQKTTLSVVVAILVSGCGPTQKDLARQAALERQNRQDATAASEVTACIQKYPRIGDNYQYAVPYSQCIIDGYNKYYNKPDDLHYAFARKRLALSNDLVNGKITYPDFQSEMSNFEVQINNIRLQREYQNLIVQQNELALKYANCQKAQRAYEEVRYRNETNPPTTGFGNTVSTLATISSSFDAAKACN